MKRFSLIIVLVFLTIHCSWGITDSVSAPKTGNLMPQYGRLVRLIAEESSGTSVTEVRSNPTILIYWAKYCASCIASFPKYDYIRAMNRDHLNVVLIAPEDTEHKRIFDTYKKEMGLRLQGIFDSSIFNNRVSKGTPYILLIDNQGIVRHEAVQISDNLIDTFLRDKAFNQTSENSTKTLYNQDSLFLVNGNGGMDTEFMYRSLLCEWKDGMATNGVGIIDHPSYLKHSKAEFLKYTVSSLYKLAYLGASSARIDGYAFKPVLETIDSGMFMNDKYFCYSLKVPHKRASKANLMKMMQNDLDNYFGYTAVVEPREYPCFYLVLEGKSSAEKIRARSSSIEFKTSPIYMRFKKIALSQVIKQINNVTQFRQPVINQTGLADSMLVDMELEGTVYDLNHIRKELLSKYGLNLVPGKTTLQTLIIRDRI